MDIIILFALTCFIFYKLQKQFGRIDEDEKNKIQEKLRKQREEIINLQNKILNNSGPQNQGMTIINPTEKKILDEALFANLSENDKQTFINILNRCNIGAEFFVNGAKSAFEMIVKAFAAADFQTLKFLLSEKIYQGFESSIKQRQEQEKLLTTNLIAIEKVDVISAMMNENFASIVVRFVSKQINYVANKDGHIIEGRKDEISTMTDVWTFKKDITSNNPNWVVVATSS